MLEQSSYHIILDEDVLVEGMVLLRDGLRAFDCVDYARLVAPPGEGAEVFLVVEGHSLAGHVHKLVGDFLVGDGEGELQCDGVCRSGRIESGP